VRRRVELTLDDALGELHRERADLAAQLLEQADPLGVRVGVRALDDALRLLAGAREDRLAGGLGGGLRLLEDAAGLTTGVAEARLEGPLGLLHLDELGVRLLHLPLDEGAALLERLVQAREDELAHHQEEHDEGEQTPDELGGLRQELDARGLGCEDQVHGVSSESRFVDRVRWRTRGRSRAARAPRRRRCR
jgi:hypothetical protein